MVSNLLSHLILLCDINKSGQNLQIASCLFQSDPGLAEVQIKTSQLMYRYLSTKSDFTYTKSGYSSEDSESSVETSSSMMNMSEDVDDLNPDEKTRLLISLVDDIHDCVDIMQNRSLLVQAVDIQQQ